MRSIKIFILFISASNFVFSQKTLSSSEIAFIENKGQVYNQYLQPNNEVKYSGRANDLVYHLKSNGISYQLSKEIAFKEVEDLKTRQKIKSTTQTNIYRIDINWLNSNKNVLIETGNEMEGYSNYYNAACPNGVIGVKSYKTLLYKNIYDGVDLKWYSNKGNLKYDFIVQPNANPNNIQLNINGAQSLLINTKGELEIKTPLGTIIEQAPIAYQGNAIIKTKWVLKNNGSNSLTRGIASFEVEDYNKNLPLIIDPALRIWGTYYGGSLIDYNYGCSTDASGNVFICGYTQSNTGTSIATIGSYQSVYAGGTNDAYLAKFTTGGTRLWATYYGGTTLDVGSACAIDNLGNVYMSGYTDSFSGISTVGSHQPSLNGNVDAFLVKFTTNGARIWGTYYGGTLNNYGYFCCTDALGNVYLSGNTSSTSGTDIATVGSHQPAHGGSTWDGFLVKFNSAGTRQWGTYYGGSGNEYGYNCATDFLNNVYFVGRTYSNTGTVIATPGSHQPIHNGSQDAFLVKFNSSGVRQWGTYYGGFGDEYGYGVATDNSGNIFLSGSSDSGAGTTIATVSSFQPINGGGFADAFVAKFDNGGIRQWGTYYGGSGYEEGISCATDILGSVYLSGQTTSTTGTIIATSGAHQPLFGGGVNDAYLVKFNPTGVRQWGTYYGETGDDYGLVCTVDNGYNIYVGGRTSTNSGNSIASSGAHQAVYGGGSFDGFLVKFFDCPALATDINGANVTCHGLSNGSATVNVSGGSGFTFNWLPTGGTATIATNLAPGTYSCVFTNSCGATATETVLISDPPSVSVTAVSSNSALCSGSSATLTATGSGGTGSFSYNWSSGGNLSTEVVSPTSNTIYTVTAQDINNCSTSTTISQNVIICTTIDEQGNKINSVSLYPNPFNNSIIIRSSIYNNRTVCVIYNNLGQEVVRQNILSAKQEINLSALSNGIYNVSIFEGKAVVFVSKIIKGN